MKIKLILFTALFALVSFLVACGGGGGSGGGTNDPLKDFKANKADRGDDWKQFRHDSSQAAYNFDENIYPTRPREHPNPGGVRVFWNGDLLSGMLDEVNAGVGETLVACMRDTNVWQPGNQWTRFEYYLQKSDYKAIFVPSTYEVQEGEERGCGAFHAYGGLPVAGAVAPDTKINGAPASKGGYYMLLPMQTAEQWARPECRRLVRNAARNEAEHLWMTNSPSLFFLFANDGQNGNHPYCLGIVSNPSARLIEDWLLDFKRRQYELKRGKRSLVNV